MLTLLCTRTMPERDGTSARPDGQGAPSLCSRRSLQTFIVTCLVSCAALAAGAEPKGLLPIPGSEQRVNAETTGYQSPARVALASDGGFLVSWIDDPRLELRGGEAPHVEARRFGREGLAVDSNDLLVNSPTIHTMLRTDVAATSDGDFVVAWEGSYGGYPGPEFELEIRARRFGRAGTSLDDLPIAVNFGTISNQTHPTVAASADGGFVVVWEESNTPIWGRRFRASGEPVDAEDLFLGIPGEVAARPAVAPLPDGGFLVVWEHWNGFGLLARRIAPDGTHADPVPFFVNTTYEGFQHDPRVETDPSGDFVVVWEDYDYGAPGPDVTVRARRFAADGTPKDLDEWMVSPLTTSNHGDPDVAVDAEGNFVVAWTAVSVPGVPGSDQTIVARRFRADGTAVDSAEVRLPSDEDSDVHEAVASIVARPDGDLLAVWRRYQESPYAVDVWMRRFGRPTIQVTAGGGLVSGLPCSLVEAIEAANSGVAVGGCPAGNEGAVIELQPGSTLQYSSAAEGINALPVIRRSVTVRGFGSKIGRDPALPCPGAPDLRLFEVADGGILTLEEVEIAGGCGSGAGGAVFANGGSVILRNARITGNRAGADGGGIAVASGNLYVTDSVFSGNASGSRGGAISVTGTTGATRIERSTLSGNSSTSGGAISIESDRIAWLSQSTVIANAASAAGGAIRLDAAGARFVLDYSTIAGNAAPQTSGVHVVSGELLLHGTVVGEGTGGTDCGEAGGDLRATRANLDTDGSCAALGGPSVSTASSFELAPLQDQGGPIPVRLPLDGSPLLDRDPKCALASGAPLDRDQRGLPRPDDDDGDGEAACDLGAVERGPIFVDGFESGSTDRWN